MLRKELTTKKSNEMNVKPTRMYEKEENIKYDDISEGDLIVAMVYQFIPPNTIYLCAGEIYAKMDLIDFYYFQEDNQNEKLVKSVYNSIGKNVLARVKEKKDGQCILERSSVIKETMELLSHNIGTVIDATVESISPFGIFVDIGNGFISLIITTEISKARIYNFEKSLKIGESIKVKLIDYDNKSGFAQISRKQAYEKLGENKLPIGSAVIVKCCNYVNKQKDGVYIEYNPNNTGIMDIPEEYLPDEFYDGRKIAVIIKHHKEVGFKASFVRFI